MTIITITLFPAYGIHNRKIKTHIISCSTHIMCVCLRLCVKRSICDNVEHISIHHSYEIKGISFFLHLLFCSLPFMVRWLYKFPFFSFTLSIVWEVNVKWMLTKRRDFSLFHSSFSVVCKHLLSSLTPPHPIISLYVYIIRDRLCWNKLTWQDITERQINFPRWCLN
jgi:hypothetical protein